MPAPEPAASWCSNTCQASRHKTERLLVVDVSRAELAPGCVALSFVRSWTRSLIVPPSPRWLKATEVNRTSGTAQAATSATALTRLRSRIVGVVRASKRSTASPANSSTAIISSRKAPNSPATPSFTDSGCRGVEKAVLERAQAETGAAPATGSSNTGRPRSLSGTIANQARAPTTAAASAPRDPVSRIATIAIPIAG